MALITIWVHGPLSPLLPAAYEPVLMMFGRMYPSLLVAAVGTAANAYIEFVNYRMFAAMDRLALYRRLTAHPLFARATRWFARRPFLTTWLFAWSPLPDWIVRLLAPAARYDVRRYLLALALGRLPRFWVIAALGVWFRIPLGWLIGIAAGSLLLTLVLTSLRRFNAVLVSTLRRLVRRPNTPGHGRSRADSAPSGRSPSAYSRLESTPSAPAAS